MKIDLPIYTTKLPVSDKTVEFTPLVVRDEKNIAAAKETGQNVDGYNTLLRIIEEKANMKVSKLSETDIIHLLLEFRKRSVGEKFKTIFICPHSNEKITLDIDCGDITLKGKSKKNQIKTDDLIINLTIPKRFQDPTSGISSIETIDEKIDFDVISTEEKSDLIENLPISVKNDITSAIDDLYHYNYVLNYVSDNVERKMRLSSAEDFFTLLFVM
jgi:hypothetical protein|tara:strand:- start:186 stop:830 length:645 start_codon:yes stop_codon:yes gene_type:complete